MKRKKNTFNDTVKLIIKRMFNSAVYEGKMNKTDHGN